MIMSSQRCLAALVLEEALQAITDHSGQINKNMPAPQRFAHLFLPELFRLDTFVFACYHLILFSRTNHTPNKRHLWTYKRSKQTKTTGIAAEG